MWHSYIIVVVMFIIILSCKIYSVVCCVLVYNSWSSFFTLKYLILQVVADDKMLYNDSIITIDPVVRFSCTIYMLLFNRKCKNYVGVWWTCPQSCTFIFRPTSCNKNVGLVSTAPSGPVFLPEKRRLDVWAADDVCQCDIIQNLIYTALLVTGNDIRCHSHAKQDQQT